MKKNQDPRFIRTRQLIMDSFMQLVIEKDFKDITIRDITERATINRATFYYHFFDKYDLLEVVLSESILNGVLTEINSQDDINIETMKNVLVQLIQFHNGLQNKCTKSYEAFTPKIETIVKEELQRVFKEIFAINHPHWTEEQKTLQSISLSWSMYGISAYYVRTGKQINEDILSNVFSQIF